MKKIVFLFVLLLGAYNIMAQDSIPEKEHKVNLSGFGGIMSATSILNKGIAECVGAGGALSINHYFYIGGYGLSLTSKHIIRDLIMHNHDDSLFYYSKAVRVNFSHAGLWIGGIFFPKKLVHLGISTKIGWGRIHMLEGEYNSYVTNTTVVSYRLDYATNKVFVITPEIEVEFGITSWLKAHLGIGYRYVSGVKFDRYKDYKFNTPEITVGIYFGGFYGKSEKEEIQTEPEEE
jgi:hypothetical protein